MYLKVAKFSRGILKIESMLAYRVGNWARASAGIGSHEFAFLRLQHGRGVVPLLLEWILRYGRCNQIFLPSIIAQMCRMGRILEGQCSQNMQTTKFRSLDME
jgi:hypothetical protein